MCEKCDFPKFSKLTPVDGMLGKRRQGKSRILTETPEKDRLEEGRNNTGNGNRNLFQEEDLQKQSKRVKNYSKENVDCTDSADDSQCL